MPYGAVNRATCMPAAITMRRPAGRSSTRPAPFAGPDEPAVKH